jgi:hypothetical protein
MEKNPSWSTPSSPPTAAAVTIAPPHKISFFTSLLFLLSSLADSSVLYEVGTIAGDSPGTTNGFGTNAQFNHITDLAIAPNGLFALATEKDNHMIRIITLSTSEVKLIAGNSATGTSNGIGSNVRFNNPTDITISPDGSYALIADHDNHRYRRLIISTGAVDNFVGKTSGSANGYGTNAQFLFPNQISIAPNGVFALAMDCVNHMVRNIIISTALVTLVAGHTSSGSVDGVGTVARFKFPIGIFISPTGTFALITDSNNHMIRHLEISTSSVTTLAGKTFDGSDDGFGTNARFLSPARLAIS